ncbi:MAG TPA: ATP-binding cassette domain-containing protein, partial [Candidatus Limnocylindrales bacterium]|nr:ATP-binding cassette domain-containing protein [Candidatus Limnocylindrales bacterium]
MATDAPAATRAIWGPDRRLAVQITDASKSFGAVMGVAGISLSVPQSAIVGIIGPSGAGKTTTIRLITGSLAPDRGEV